MEEKQMSAECTKFKRFCRHAWFLPLMLAVVIASGAILLDGATKASYALTAADCLACHATLIPAPYTNMKDYHHSLRPVCSSCHNNPDNPDPYDKSWYANKCDACHYPGTTAIGALTVSEAHGPLHDSTDVPDALCLDCHSPAVFVEHQGRIQFIDAQGDFNCVVCHNDNPIYDAAIQKGAGGQTVYCNDCHTDIGATGHAADHDNVLPNPNAGCDAAGCHQSNVMIEHTNRANLNGCNTCHGNDTPLVVGLDSPQTVIAGAAGPLDPTRATTAYCYSCHGMDAGMHAAAHDQGFFVETPTGQDCTVCHATMGTQANIVGEHVTNQGFSCQICHNQEVIDLNPADVAAAIDKGSNQNLPVYCVDCHAPTGQGEGHNVIAVEPWFRCSWCHSAIGDPNAGRHTMHVEAVQTAQADGSIPLNLLANNECSACHVPETSSPNCKACHSLDDSIFEPLDIFVTAPNESLNIIGPGTEDHDKHTNSFTDGGCTFCHVSGAPGADPLPPPYNECSNCHTALKYGQETHNIHIDPMWAGNDCSRCHTSQPDCASCHSPGHPSFTAPYSECDQCHTGLQPMEPVHEAHRADSRVPTTLSGLPDCAVCHVPTGTQPDCTQCHIADDGSGHAGVHDNVGVPSQGCTQCHDANVVVEHVDNRGLTCGTCHDNAAFTTIIDLGKTDDPANFVECYDCHDQNNHHATTESQSGNCTYCHADPRPAVEPTATVIPSGQLSCRECHGTNQHNNGGPIQDYSACFACHLGIQPYHAKPTSWPGWYEENQPAPGRGSFNIFSSEFRPRCAGDCEGTSYERLSGYGEDGRPARDAGRNWRSPNISFNWITFFDFFNTNQEWTVPIFEAGSGGGGGTTPPPSTDSVHITYADYSSYRDRLTVYAENTLGDSNNTQLTVKYNNNDYPMSWSSYRNRWEVQISSRSCYDSTIEVVSSAGGSDSSSVANCSSYSSWSR